MAILKDQGPPAGYDYFGVSDKVLDGIQSASPEQTKAAAAIVAAQPDAALLARMIFGDQE